MLFQDKLNHASLLDAAHISSGKLVRYKHCDSASLQQALVIHDTAQHTLLVTETVFSMDGDEAPLAALAQIAAAHKLRVAVDEAHGFGVYGEKGAGLLESLGIGQKQVPLIMATFGKALGCAGAFVAGPDELIEFMVQKARSYIYSTALAPALANAALQSLSLVREEGWRRRHLFDLVQRFRDMAMRAKLPVGDSGGPVQPLVVGSSEKALALSESLRHKGVLITAIRPPTVPANTARLRITLSAGHSFEDVDLLLAALTEAFSENGLL